MLFMVIERFKDRNPLPIYARLREQGRVRMQCLVKADGTVTMLQVLSGPPILREAALETQRRSMYEPAKKGGKPVPFAMLYTVTFRLN